MKWKFHVYKQQDISHFLKLMDMSRYVVGMFLLLYIIALIHLYPHTHQKIRFLARIGGK